MADHDMRGKFGRITQLLTQGDATAAEKLAVNCTILFPDIAEGWFLLGVARHLLQKRQDALSAFERTLALLPSHLQALRAKAAVLSEMGRLEDAIAVCQQALQQAPNDPDLIANLGTVLERKGGLDEALDQFNLALAQDEGHLPSLLNRGALLMRMQRLQEALVHNRQFVELHPTYPDAYYNLSETLRALHLYEEALSVCAAGLGLAPNHAPLHLNQAISLAALRHFEESQAALAHAQILNPDLLQRLIPEVGKLPMIVDPYASAETVYLEENAAAMQACFWNERPSLLETLQEFIYHGTPSGLALHDKRLAFTLLALPVSSEQHLCVLKQISEYVQDTAWLYALPPFRHPPRKQERIKIGYISPDFRDHPIGHLTKGLYGAHDRAKFEIYCYSLIKTEDAIQQEISASCDQWRDFSNISNAEAAQTIHEDSIDILIDLAGYTNMARTEILALRPAPIQVNYLGYPGTMGATFMDYLIGDPVITPYVHAAHFTEKLLHMPHTYQPNSRPQAFATPPSRAECGLPETGFVFCGFNQAFKISPEIFDIWMRLLQKVPGSILWLLEAGPVAEQNLRKEAQVRGVEDQRLIFAPRVPWLQHLIRQQHADLLLDTFPYNAHTTASDALWAGVPVVTCMGETFPSRVAASLLHAVGLPELVTTSLETYEQLAVRLASSPQELQTIRQTLASNRQTAPLFNTRQFVRDLEALYEQMLQARQ